MKKSAGFSLVEMLVVLIGISIIMAALMPVITKKLSSNSIAIGSGNLAITSECSEKYSDDCRLCDSRRCIMCELECPEGQSKDKIKCECFQCSTKYGVNCLNCNDIKCIKCDNGYYINNGNCEICPAKNYCDGISKKVCELGKYQDETGKTSCKDCSVGYKCVDGEKIGCSAGTYSSSNASTCIDCSEGYKCTGAADKILCSNGKEYQDAIKQSSCKECLAGNYVSSDRKECKTCEKGYKCPGDGTRVTCSGSKYQDETGKPDCDTCSSGYYTGNNAANTSCTICPSGYTCDGTSTQLTTCANGTYLSGNTCEICLKGYYCTGNNKLSCPTGTYLDTRGGASSSDCKTCESKTTNCTICDAKTGECSACKEGYNLTSGACEEENNSSCGEGFDDNLFMKVNVGSYDMCVIKYNMGDMTLLPSTITNINVGTQTTCGSSSDYTSLCCWSGGTSQNCDSENGGYSGCNRTVCNWAAANEICNNLTYNNKTWRLLTSTELAAIDVNTYSKNQGTNGIMLCDSYASGTGSAKCVASNLCLGAHLDYCEPGKVWSSSENSTSQATYSNLSEGSWFSNSYYKNRPKSVRCATTLN